MPTKADLVTAELVASRCERYRPIVERNTEYWDLDPDLVLAVMAKESGCMSNIISGDGHHTIGLMQVSEKSWTTTEAHLLNPDTNIYWGMYILYSAINNPIHNPDHSVTRGLAAYNCGWTSLEAGKCIPVGGWNYATSVMLFWRPVITGQLTYDAYIEQIEKAPYFRGLIR